MNTIFLDCGSNFGQGFEEIKHNFNLSNPIVYMFEPNPNCFCCLKEKYPLYNLNNVAVWNKNERRILNMEYLSSAKAPVGGWSNILEDNYIIPTWVPKENVGQWKVEVDCIDFSGWVKKNINQADNVYMKMDIEGAEIEVLDKMIEDNVLVYINHIIIEWHFHLRKNNPRNIDFYLKEFKKLGISYTVWH